MRWRWIDRFLEFERGQRAVTVKNVCFAEEQIEDYAPGYPIMPGSLVIEGMAQTGGMLVAEYWGFEQHVVLAKVGKVQFHFHPVIGDTLVYRAVAHDIKPDGAIVTATSHVGERLQAEADMVFALLDSRFEGVEFFDPAALLLVLRVLKLYTVGRREDGSPLVIPPHMAAAERALDGLEESRGPSKKM